LTSPYAINDSQNVVGVYWDAVAKRNHGFVLSAGLFRTIDIPDAFSTGLNGINAVGTVVGGYVEKNWSNHGFLLSKSEFRVIDVPGAVGTSANGINASGAIVGNYVDSQGMYHGFFAVTH